MALTKSTIVVDGVERPHFIHDGTPGESVIFTGPIYGAVATSDGTRYRVDDDYIVVPTEHAGEVGHAIGVRHEQDGNPMHGDPHAEDYVPFQHVCDDSCGALKRSKADHPTAETLTKALRRKGR